jgi:dipeptidyl aminopeptidase/acylaminoacyl peptidase
MFKVHMERTLTLHLRSYEKWDPLIHAKNFSTPEFVIGNDLDYRVVISEPLQTFNVLQSLGVPSRVLHFPNEGHWVTNRDNSLFWHQALFNWIKHWAGGFNEELMTEGVITQ